MEEMTTFTSDLRKHWANISPILTIRNQSDYNLAIEHLNELLDEVGDNERHPLYSLLDTLGTIISVYEDEQTPLPVCSGAEMLRFFMEENNLQQSDMPEIGSQGVISELLHGQRELNVRQIRLLAERFHVSPAVFM